MTLNRLCLILSFVILIRIFCIRIHGMCMYVLTNMHSFIHTHTCNDTYFFILICNQLNTHMLACMHAYIHTSYTCFFRQIFFYTHIQQIKISFSDICQYIILIYDICYYYFLYTCSKIFNSHIVFLQTRLQCCRPTSSMASRRTSQIDSIWIDNPWMRGWIFKNSNLPR